MRVKTIHMATGLMMGLLLTGAAVAADQPVSQAPYAHGDEAKLPNGVIGLSLQVGAERVGDPAVLYVGMVRPEGPALSKQGSNMEMRSRQWMGQR